MEKGAPRRQDINRLSASRGDGTNLVPQIIFNSVDEFKALTTAVKNLGYTRVDLNLGCPYPMQTGKGRGAALIDDPATLEGVARMIADDRDTRYSVKTRLGMTSPQGWKSIMPILNSLSLAHVTLHPRIARQMYGGELYEEEFAAFMSESTNPVLWNGDIITPDDIDRVVSKFPAVKGVMIGRGLLVRPSLAEEWRTGQEWDRERRIDTLLDMHGRLLSAYEASLCGPTQVLQKIKPFWEYLEPEIGHKAYKTIRKATTLERYVTAINFITT